MLSCFPYLPGGVHLAYVVKSLLCILHNPQTCRKKTDFGCSPRCTSPQVNRGHNVFSCSQDSPSKPSVAELAGRLEGHVQPMSSSNDEMPRRPPCSLKLQLQKNDNKLDKTAASPNPFKVKMKNSPTIGKLQANLALSPTALLPSPKTPEVKLQLAPLPPTTPGSPLSPTLQPSQLSTEEEDPISFDSPPDSATLQSINKTRARLSFKRRLPTRQHRRSAVEEAGPLGSSLSSCELYSPKDDKDQDEVFERTPEEDECRQPGSLEEAEDTNMDCEKTEDKVTKSDPDNKVDVEEERALEQDQSSEPLEAEQQPLKQTEGDVTAEEKQEEMVEEAQQGGSDEV
ncbi:capZ-interacting protein isoform X1 [Channa argus]|uniref:capZ-interacting protein isoform X1 n=2 Tax=Channa argus TaxID=215402 RepID=UPI0035205D88